MFNNNEINLTLTPYQIDYLKGLLTDKLINSPLQWNREDVMLEGMIEQFEQLTADLRRVEQQVD